MDTSFQVELLRRQYLQLQDPSQLSIPARNVIKKPKVQAQIFDTMFREGNLAYEPPDRYKLRVLKKLLEAIEAAVEDPEEDV